jgi:cytochrome c-type biogenesis protein CcmH/NrfG
MYLQTGKLDDSIRFAQAAVKTEPGNANGHVTLGSAYATMGRLDDAERHFQEALRLDPSNESARVNLQKIAQARGGR